MARSQLLLFSFPLKAGFFPYIAGPALLSASAIVRALLPLLMVRRAIFVKNVTMKAQN
jgi:hypothetical protein